MSGDVIIVPPLSRARIRAFADVVRTKLGGESAFFPIVETLELVLPRLDDDYVFEVCSKGEMGNNHGLTFPQQRKIQIREDIYIGACDGNGRDRFTLAHELGHLLIHADVKPQFARRSSEGEVKTYMTSEWQADCFAGELLMPAGILASCSSKNEAAEMFGVSLQAATVQMRHMKR